MIVAFSIEMSKGLVIYSSAPYFNPRIILFLSLSAVSRITGICDEVCLQTILTDDLKRIESIETLQDFIANAIESKSIAEVAPVVAPVVKSSTFEELKEGDSIGTYSIHKTLGKGGYSKVFKVKHRIQDTFYALKLFNESVNFSSVKDEYDALINLNHPNIVQFKWNDEAAIS